MNIETLQRSTVKALVPYNPELLAEYRYKIDANENGYDIPLVARKKILSELKKLTFNRYPEAGSSKLRSILAKKNGVNPNNIVIGNGSDELIHYLLQAFTDKNDKIVAPAPSFDMYRILALTNGAKPVIVPLNDNFDLDEKAMILAAKNAKFIFLAYPNNPTGNCFSEEIIRRIIKAVDCFVVIDEAYFEFSGKSFLKMMSKNKKIIILRTFSKAYSLASMRVGYMLAAPEIIRVINKVRLPYNLNTVSMICACIMAKTNITKVVKKIRLDRDKLYASLKKDYLVVKSDANFLLIKVNNGNKVKNLFEKNGISVRMFKTGRLKNFLRITIGTPDENMAALKILKRGV
ncbi:MAG: histidinol-phosphate transaminase [bacterium]